jgi:F-type H+-transporting ATPase subunit epsilon
MARTLLCEIVTPERIVYHGEVQMVVAMTTTGEIGVLPLHAPLVSTLAPGQVRLKIGEAASEWENFAVSGGYIQVHEDKVIVLADAAVSVADIDRAKVTEALEAARERLAALPADADDARNEAELEVLWNELQLTSADKRSR